MQSRELNHLPITCIVGDGECNEGIIWETLEFINQRKFQILLFSLIVISGSKHKNLSIQLTTILLLLKDYVL